MGTLTTNPASQSFSALQKPPKCQQDEKNKTAIHQSNSIALNEILTDATAKLKSVTSSKKSGKKRKRPPEDISISPRKQRFNEPNLTREAVHLIVLAEQYYYAKTHGEIAAAETLATTMAKARELVLSMRAGKKDKKQFDFEKFKAEAAEYDAWLEQAKKAHPNYFNNIKSPFGDKLKDKDLDGDKFIANIDEPLEKTLELIAQVQGEIPLCMLFVERTLNDYRAGMKMAGEGLTQRNRSTSATIRNQRSQ